MLKLFFVSLFLSFAYGIPRYLVYGTWYGQATNQIVDLVVSAGFNGIRLVADWSLMQPTSPDPSTIDWSVLDSQLSYVGQTNLSIVLGVWLKRKGPDAVVPASGLQVNSSGSSVQNFAASILFNLNSTTTGLAQQFMTLVVSRYSGRYGAKILCYCVQWDGYSETEYFAGGQFDYSNFAVTDFQKWLASRYGSITALNMAWGTSYDSFASVKPPANPATGNGNSDKDWYRYRHSALSGMIELSQAILQSVAPTARHSVQWGSTYDTAVRLRATILFPYLINGKSQVVWVDDAPSYPHTFAMDYLRSNLPNGTWLANEIDSPTLADDNTYYQLAAESYLHGAAIISVANWDQTTLTSRISLFQTIAHDFLGSPVPNIPDRAVMNISASTIFAQGSAVSYFDEYNTLSYGGQDWVYLELVNDLA